MIIIYTCPKCGHDLQMVSIATYPPIDRYECYNCGWTSETEKPQEIIRVPYKEIPPYTPPYIPPWDQWTTSKTTAVPPNCRYCSNHPSNGGSGICHCILGTQGTYC